MRFFAITIAIVAVLITGCAGYKIGFVQPTVMKGVTTLGIPTFRNTTLEPHLEVLVTDSVIKQFQQDGTYRIVSDKISDAIVKGTIVGVIRRPARSVRGNVEATREFVLRLRIKYTAIDRVTGKVLFNQVVEGQTSFFVGGDVQQDERQALGLAAQDAAVQITSQLSEGW